ncbi:response regulator [Candidatus Sumerlaeota bacterium]|nr:response regulator [Candidatus Sumerlaeota bacterium]
MFEIEKPRAQLLAEISALKERVKELEGNGSQGHENLDEMLRQNQKLEAIGQLAGGIAHDFNNLLTVVINGIQLLKITEDPDKCRQLLANLEQACQRGIDLVRQLLAFGRKSEVEMRPIDLREVIAEVVSITSKTFDRRIEMLIEAEDSLPCVLADPGQMHQVLLNLCVNARDALDQISLSDPPPKLRITMGARCVHITEQMCRSNPEASPGDYVLLSVSDTGAGIDPETQRRIFEPFFTTKGRGKGTGLGLATAYGIVKQHSGWISVESEVGRGTTFSILLPVVDAALASAEEEDSEPLTGGDETILLADDEEMIRDVSRMILENLGYHVILAADGQESVDTFLANRDAVGLVILDISMPRLSGLEAMRQILSNAPDTRVILSSGYSETALGRKHIRQLGAADYILKPFTPPMIAQIVRKVLDSPSPASKRR